MATISSAASKLLRKAKATKDVKMILKKEQGHLVATALAELTYDQDGTSATTTTTLEAPSATSSLQLAVMTKLLSTVEELADEAPHNILVICYLTDNGYQYQTIINSTY